MNELLKKIISIEEKAQQIIESAHDEKHDIEEQIHVEMKKLEEEIVERQQKKIQELQSLEYATANDEAEKVHARTEEQVKAMDEIAAGQMDQWVEDLFNAVISR